MENITKYTDALLKGIVYVVFVILCFFGKEIYNSINDMNANLNEIRVELAKIQATQLTEQRVEEIAKRVYLEHQK